MTHKFKWLKNVDKNVLDAKSYLLYRNIKVNDAPNANWHFFGKRNVLSPKNFKKTKFTVELLEKVLIWNKTCLM